MMRSNLTAKKLTIVYMVCSIAISCCNRQSDEKKQINLIFRFDDYSARSSTEIELKIIDAFNENEGVVTFGVIPFVCAGDGLDPSPQELIPLNTKKRDLLKNGYNNKILEIALHGFSHQTIDPKHGTEFRDLAYNDQFEKIRKGKKILESIINAPVTTFVPPWNSFDINTLRVLKELKFSTLSADRKGEITEDSTLKYLPATCELFELRDAVKAARKSYETQPVIVVLFHEYDFYEINSTLGTIFLNEFYDLLSWVSSQKDINMLTVDQAAKIIKNLSAKRYLLNKKIYSLLDLAPSKVLKGEKNLYASTTKTLFNFRVRITIFYLIIFILVAFASFMIGIMIFPKSMILMKIAKFGSIVLSVFILVYAFHDMQVNYRGLIASVGMISAVIGIWSCSFYLKKKHL